MDGEETLMWWWVLGACAIAYVTKAVGYLVDAEKLQHPTFLHVAAGLTAGLLASLVVTNTIADGQSLVIDARLAALAAGALALAARAPFIVVVIIGAVAAAVARLLGAG